MLSMKVFIVLATCLSWSYCREAEKYCSLCQDHTMCKYEGLGEQCINPGGSGITKKERREILDTHNWARRVVASGQETRGLGGGQPKAANLMKMKWDVHLAEVAQRWADQCQFEHDTCRSDPRWEVGQNIFWKWKYPNHNVNWTEAILSWYNEVAQYNPHGVGQYRFESATGHYTQMLWHSTFAVGCGRRDYGQNKIYVCNYGPAGNWIGQPMYQVGEPCSQCPKGTVCEDNLCAIQSINTEIEILPESPGVDTNALRSLMEATFTINGNESINLDEFKPPGENFYVPIVGDGNPSGSMNQTQLNAVDDEIRKLKDVPLDSEKEETTEGNSIDKNEIDLDADTKQGIEEIKSRIEGLLKNVIKKLTLHH